MSKYEMKKFQKRASERYLKIIEMIDYREIIKNYSQNPTDPTLSDNANGKNDCFHIQLDAPTGSGKTVLLANVLKDYHKEYVCLVFSPGAGNLQEQTASRISEIMGESNVVLVDDTTFAQEFATGVVYVGNWEKFVSREKKTGDYKTKIVREGDNRNFFDAIREVGNKGIPVIVCIDEAHHGQGSVLSSIRSFLDDIQYNLGYSPLYFEISATPIHNGPVHPIRISLAEVQAEELIRKNVRLNGASLLASVKSLTKEQRASLQVEPFLIDQAIKLQNEIDARYIEKDIFEMIDNEKVYLHSLIGLQIPNGTLGNEARERTEIYLRDKYNITRDNDKLFVYLSDDNDKIAKKALLTAIASPSSPVKVLLYKQGVTTGWDCPRAQILLGFRHITSMIFTKQNLGRYVRTAQQKYYNDDLLDHAYIISNIGDLGGANFGDDVDANFKYEKQSILRVATDKHYALSSFNQVKLERSHYARVNQTKVPPEDMKAKWAKAAKEAKLWKQLEYSNSALLSQTRIISGIINNIDKGEVTEDAVSEQIADNDRKQYRDLEEKIYGVIVENGRDYGVNAQIARTLTRIIIRWYRECVWSNKDALHQHFGQRQDILAVIAAERSEELRFAEPDPNDFAVEQLSLDDSHFNAVKAVINKMLESIPSMEMMTEDDYRLAGSKFDQRELTKDSDFIVSVTEAVWTPAVVENLVGRNSVGVPSAYAYHLVSEEKDDASYREGLAALSGPEESFESKAIPSLVGQKGVRLCYYMKSPENSNRSYRIGVSSLDGSKVSDFYPDYIGELYNPKGAKGSEYTPVILEVKSESDVLGAEKRLDSLLLGKAKALVDLTENYAGLKDSLPVKAAVVYERKHESADAEWVAITGVSETGQITVKNLRDWLLEVKLS